MACKRQAKRKAPLTPRVVIHPEFHRALAVHRGDTGQTMQDRLHQILCREFRREDLDSDRPSPSS